MPMNSSERFFAVTIDLLGLIGFSTFVSSITTSMTQLRSLSQAKAQEDYDLRLFLHNNSISLELKTAVMNFASSYKHVLKTKTDYGSIDVICNLPLRLQRLMLNEMYFPIFRRHPCFGSLISLDQPFAEDLVKNALSDRALHKGEALFLTDDLAEGMYFVANSSEMVSKAPLLCYRRLAVEIDIASGQWMCEAAIMMEGWRFRGDCHAHRRADISVLTTSKFLNLLGKYATAGSVAVTFISHYAALFLETPPSVEAVLWYSGIWSDQAQAEAMMLQARDAAGVTVQRGNAPFRLLWTRSNLS
uniref:Cyclic nucleotide-binding domain-containing protein n=1 Tax=Zooxanthella nutricula TaxID=1333877 RepID=A0A7S2K0H6_9DINO